MKFQLSCRQSRSPKQAKECKGNSDDAITTLTKGMLRQMVAEELLSIAGKGRSGGTTWVIQSSRSFSARVASFITSTLSIKICSLQLYDDFFIAQVELEFTCKLMVVLSSNHALSDLHGTPQYTIATRSK
jgi:hypothetical protein